MKKNPATILLTMLLCLAMLLPAAGATAETKSIFMPDYIVDLYNEAVPAFWKTFLKSEIPDNYKEEFTLKFDSQEEDRIYYTNSSSTLVGRLSSAATARRLRPSARSSPLPLP